MKKNDLARQTIAAVEHKGPETAFKDQIQNLVWNITKGFPLLEKVIEVSLVDTNIDGEGPCCFLLK